MALALAIVPRKVGIKIPCSFVFTAHTRLAKRPFWRRRLRVPDTTLFVSWNLSWSLAVHEGRAKEKINNIKARRRLDGTCLFDARLLSKNTLCATVSHHTKPLRNVPLEIGVLARHRGHKHGDDSLAAGPVALALDERERVDAVALRRATYADQSFAVRGHEKTMKAILRAVPAALDVRTVDPNINVHDTHWAASRLSIGSPMIISKPSIHWLWLFVHEEKSKESPW
ncbi:hypothetical protein F4824DRAFT_506952 [Ustulina deusta]|nr:hypothetical protein F4824DRAFT_506952 [Ustulina deusta]